MTLRSLVWFSSKAERDKWWADVNAPFKNPDLIEATKLIDARHSKPSTTQVVIPRAWQPPPPAPRSGPARPKAVAAPPVERRQEYEALAEELGVVCREVETMKLKELLHRHHMPIYDLAEVDNYLDSLIPPGEKSILFWCWYALRPIPGHKRESYFNVTRRTTGYPHQLYNLTVPIHVLRRVKTLLADDQSLEFYVNQLRVHPDPFLLVKRPESESFVIAAWDEPGFEGLPEVV